MKCWVETEAISFFLYYPIIARSFLYVYSLCLSWSSFKHLGVFPYHSASFFNNHVYGVDSQNRYFVDTSISILYKIGDFNGGEKKT